MSLFQRLNNIKARTPEGEGAGSKNKEASPSGPALFPGAREINLDFGSCLLLEDSSPGCLPFPSEGQISLQSNLQLIRGVGPVNEMRLKEQGLKKVSQLVEHPRWGQEAGRVYELIQKQKYVELQRLGARDIDWLSLFNPEDLIFLDIETTGLWASQPLFLIGLLYFRNGQMATRQFLARNYQEEKAALAAAHLLLQRFKIIVTYNGKRFDVPYIAGRSVAHRLFFSYPHLQVDMLYHARRLYSGRLPNCRLITLEENLLDFKRQGDIPGHLIPETYHRFAQRQEPELIMPVLEHNKLDLIAMARLFGMVGQEA